MSTSAADLQEMAAVLRDNFDRAFSLPLPPRQDAPRQILRLVALGREFACRLEDLSGMHLDPRLARVPAAPEQLLGLTTVRGRTWPVYDLCLLLGQERQPRPRVLCLLRGQPRAAFVCEAFRGLIHVPPSAIVDAPSSVGSSKAVRLGDDFIRLLDPSKLVFNH